MLVDIDNAGVVVTVRDGSCVVAHIDIFFVVLHGVVHDSTLGRGGGCQRENTAECRIP